MILAKRLNGVSESATLKLNAAVQAMKAKGEDIVNLSAGEPDFAPPKAAIEAVEKALRENKSKYTPVPGIPELRELVAKKTNAQQSSLKNPWKSSDIVVSNGGKQAIFNTLMALIGPGDEVLVPAPYWLSYPEMVKLAEGTPVIVPTTHENKLLATVADLKKKVTPKTKILILNSPSNPTGATYSFDQYAEIGKWLATDPTAKNILVISDEIYDQILFTGKPFVSFLQTTPELRDRVITINGMSKGAAMTGWRIGWTVATSAITQAINTLQGQSTSGICALSQAAAVAALTLPPAEFAANQKTYHHRRDLALEILRQAEKLKVVPPEGAFYIFLNIGAYLKPGEDSLSFAERLLADAKVAAVPGGPFGADDSLRISFATDETSLKKGCERIRDFLNRC